jgi:hypothetical protein
MKDIPYLRVLFFLMILCLVSVAAQAATPAAAQMASPTWVSDPQVVEEITQNPDIVRVKLEAAMRALLNSPDKLEVKLTAVDTASAAHGLFSRIHIQTENGTIDGLKLHKADVEFLEVQLNTTKLLREEKIDTVNVRDINMDVIIRQDDLNAFLAGKSKKIGVDNPRVEMLPGKINLSGSTKYSFMKVKFWGTGVFAVNQGKSIWFHPRKLQVNGMGMPRAFIGTIVKRINPVLNLDKFPFRLNLQEIRIQSGSLQFTSRRSGN